ncbi:twin-arginine translocase subunit TatC [Rubripirellula sp.]|nr:twin-arginine translocase subunit TatC [Rubripirellula sp.]MDF1840627.1 twin-arginine translocase subunit TatC [Rubripirellula sp.]
MERPQDDLFENSTMTFGEHLEELRHSLVRAAIALAAGLVLGLLVADRVVLFVQTPLQSAIQKFNADRALYQLNYDPADEANRDLYEFLSTNALVWEIVYEIPDEYQALSMDSMQAAQVTPDSNVDSSNEGEDDQSAPGAPLVVKPVEMANLLDSLPDPSALKPTIQLRQNKTGLSSLKMEEPFMIWVKAGLIVGAVFASPLIFYYLWNFVAAGLHRHERNYVYLYLPASVVLFITGVVLAFFLVLHYVLSFLLAFNGSMDVAIEPRLSYYVNFVLLLPLGFGIAFQLPLVMLFLQRIGLFETQAYIESWKVAVLVIFVISMIVTPADVTSMIALAIPLIFLYVLGILMCKFIPRGRGLGSGAYDPA